VDQPALYVAIAVVALVAALWLTLMILGFFFKALFLALIVVVAVAVFRSWSSAPRGSARR
jgi:hypothetical protein